MKKRRLIFLALLAALLLGFDRGGWRAESPLNPVMLVPIVSSRLTGMSTFRLESPISPIRPLPPKPTARPTKAVTPTATWVLITKPAPPTATYPPRPTPAAITFTPTPQIGGE